MASRAVTAKSIRPVGVSRAAATVAASTGICTVARAYGSRCTFVARDAGTGTLPVAEIATAMSRGLSVRFMTVNAAWKRSPSVT